MTPEQEILKEWKSIEYDEKIEMSDEEIANWWLQKVATAREEGRKEGMHEAMAATMESLSGLTQKNI